MKIAAIPTFLSLALTAVAQPAGKVQVFILAGQSNMEGKAKLSLLEHQVKDPKTWSVFAHLQKDGAWIVRDDVWIKFLDRQGPLTIGFGSPGCIGPELQFGHTMGDRVDAPVLLIKTAWGGRSLYRDFRSPGAGLPVDAVLQRMLADQRKRNPAATLDDVKASSGAAYRLMLEEVRRTLAGIGAVIPGYDQSKGHELAGFVWFQGWNDMINADYTAEYTSNMASFIRDVRRDLGAPALPFVIGQMGVDGMNAGANIQKFKAAQATAAALPEFKDNVILVRTDEFWDTEAEAVFKKGWREHLDEWNTVGSDYPYHYLGSAKTHVAIGRAFAEAILKLNSPK